MADERDSNAKKDGLRLGPKTIAMGALGVLLLLFWAANRNTVKVSFLLFDARVRIWIALLLSAAVGFALGMLVARRRS